jgi:putative PIN family toxin of toxin-antitoxin system
LVRVVLDTNVVVDWLVFDDPAVRPLARAIQNGEAQALTREDCLAELHRVLGYPAFALEPAAQHAAYERYLSHVQVVEGGADPYAPLPRCQDADDQKFLELAWQSEAQWLVTRDKALLQLARRVATLGRFRIVAPALLVLERVG